MKKLLLFIFVFFLLIINVNAAPSKEECQKALTDTAYAYYYRGKALQYDSKALTFQNHNKIQQRSGGAYGTNYSKGVFYPPEDATTQDTKYTVCSGFTALVLYETFKNTNTNEGFLFRGSDGTFLRNTIKIITLGDSSSDKDIVVYYNDKIYEYKTNKQTDKLKAVYKKIQEVLEPGDIIVRTTIRNKGHALMYVGNDTTLESGGDGRNRESNNDDNIAKYDFLKKSDNIEADGTVTKRKLYRYSNNWNEFSISKKIDGYNGPKDLLGGVVEKIIVIRVSNRVSNGNTWKISDNAKNRSKYSRLSFTKTANRSKYASIALGDSITYTISLTNHSSKDYKGISVTDEVPANTTLEEMTTSYSGKNNNGKLSWNVNVPAKKTVKITYKVRVYKDSKLYGNYITSNKTKVNKIKLNTIKTLLVRHLTTDTKNKLDNLKVGSSYSSTGSFLNYLYSGYNFEEPDKIINHLFKTKELTNKWGSTVTIAKGRKQVTTYILKESKSLSNDDKKYMDMFVDGLFGGYFTYKETTKTFNDDRSFSFNSSSFQKGDILLLVDYNYKDDTKTMGINSRINAYVYLGSSKFATVNNKKLEIIDKTKGDKLLEGLLAQDCFIVLRPMKNYQKTSQPSEPTPSTPAEPTPVTPKPETEPSSPMPSPEPTPSNPEEPDNYPVDEPSAPREESEILNFIREYVVAFIIVILILGTFVYITISSNKNCKVRK